MKNQRRKSAKTDTTRHVATTAPKQTDKPAPKPYERTPAEKETVNRLLERAKLEAPSPKMKVRYVDGRPAFDIDHRDELTGTALLLDAIGTTDAVLADNILMQLANIARTGKELTSREMNLMIATVRAIAPRDATETLLATQMAAVHSATIIAARRLNHVETIPQQDSANNLLNKLARTFAVQLEALKRYRSSGEQRVTVHHQHVSVSANQAVVGVTQGGGGTNENRSQSHALGENAEAGAPDARSPALLGQEQAVGVSLPRPSGEGTVRVPDARRASGST